MALGLKKANINLPHAPQPLAGLAQEKPREVWIWWMDAVLTG
jgi:hypothetical protein